MKWEKAREIFRKEPWLLMALGITNYDALAKCKNEAEKDKWIRNWCECQLTHLMFRPFEGLNPCWRPQSTQCAIATTPGYDLWSSPYTPYDEFNDNLGYGVSYILVVETTRPEGTKNLVIRRFEKSQTSSPSFRWFVINRYSHWRSRGITVDCIAVIRNTWIISRGEYLFNAYDIYKFPQFFNPFPSWYQVQSLPALA